MIHCLYFYDFLADLTCLEIVCAATNARAETQVSGTPQARPWIPVQPIELLRWLGLLFYMANHIEASRKAYWQVSGQGTRSQLRSLDVTKSMGANSSIPDL